MTPVCYGFPLTGTRDINAAADNLHNVCSNFRIVTDSSASSILFFSLFWALVFPTHRKYYHEFFWGSRLIGYICNPYTPTQFSHRLPRCGNFSRAIIDVFHFPIPLGQTRDISSFINNWVIGWSLRQCQRAAARPWKISNYPERLWWESVRDAHHLLIRRF